MGQPLRPWEKGDGTFGLMGIGGGGLCVPIRFKSNIINWINKDDKCETTEVTGTGEILPPP